MAERIGYQTYLDSVCRTWLRGLGTRLTWTRSVGLGTRLTWTKSVGHG